MRPPPCLFASTCQLIKRAENCQLFKFYIQFPQIGIWLSDRRARTSPRVRSLLNSPSFILHYRVRDKNSHSEPSFALLVAIREKSTGRLQCIFKHSIFFTQKLNIWKLLCSLTTYSLAITLTCLLKYKIFDNIVIYVVSRFNYFVIFSCMFHMILHCQLLYFH